MKTLKSVVLGICLLLACSVVKANNIVKEDKTASPYFAINTYVDAVSLGKVEDLDLVVDKSAKFSMLRGKDILSYDKDQMLGFLKANKGIEQTCTVKTSVVSNNADVTVVKVDMQYADFLRSNYITVSNTGSGWKITDVYSVFK
ncbi:nuclear transport factor 2 family protein [Mucilaginibacter sp. KACC 22063]|uniref:nuclear transport factor 2 family protein n=1 Tax=Mucilaginibacter sp. KACC 22063 TaxID=3025666 RepID=UPI002366926B|nr:nuclear transport factor 2 family protein [Mucilaginibacter sp. KACC 22063]WDF54569.1 nuclear transport factor 2 family protein [Mucilaginibacter sp. KACC 22063]